MPLNILKHKSWNPHKPENVERVKRDEEAARQEALAKEKQQERYVSSMCVFFERDYLYIEVA